MCEDTTCVLCLFCLFLAYLCTIHNFKLTSPYTHTHTHTHTHTTPTPHKHVHTYIHTYTHTHTAVPKEGRWRHCQVHHGLEGPPHQSPIDCAEQTGQDRGHPHGFSAGHQGLEGTPTGQEEGQTRWDMGLWTRQQDPWLCLGVWVYNVVVVVHIVIEQQCMAHTTILFNDNVYLNCVDFMLCICWLFYILHLTLIWNFI